MQNENEPMQPRQPLNGGPQPAVPQELAEQVNSVESTQSASYGSEISAPGPMPMGAYGSGTPAGQGLPVTSVENQQTSPVEPMSVGQSVPAAQALVSTPLSAPAASGLQPSQKKSKKMLVIILSIVGMLVAVGIAAAVYFFVIRVSDEEYTKATESVGTLQSQSKKFSEFNGQLLDGLFAVNDADVEDAVGFADKYNKALKALQDSAVITRDGASSAEFNKVKQRVVTYGSEMNRVTEIVQGMKKHFAVCNQSSDDLGEGATLEKCLALLKSNETYPDASLDEWYQEFKKLMLETYTLLSSVQAKSKDAAAVAKATADMQDLTERLKAHHAKLKLDISEKYPKDELKSLDGFLSERKAVFFR